ncbi:D-tyrosyl-tRNA deacylase [Lasiosphaeris hirsuta]|uniref:D-aminoacyl-tRNA deacylase n=1 Tax=Lasiosphaeris hirsuta TaxID=260670 RepID=A0AA40A1J9_9PEZI|nr:D-tyrosyl-tRNA deacylase [Lasiosphaeris hirsuta]
MRVAAILQRVLSASVIVDREVVSSIGKGIVVFAAMAPGDTEKEADSLAAKVLKLKLWDDESGGRWKKSVKDIDGEVLCERQQTGFPRCSWGDEAKTLYQYFQHKVQEGYAAEKVKDGVFQAMMQVALVNDGPVKPPCSNSPFTVH